MSINLNDRLVRTSKKFTKACDQIKLLKQRIAELIAVFTYCDPTVVNNSNTNINVNNNLNLNNSNYINNNYNNNDNNNNSNNNINNNTTNLTCINDYNVNLFKESIRQQIENLQSIKTAYFIYAHHKADEITKLQCEIYGEAAVREAYEQAPPSVLIAASASDDQNSLGDVEHSTDEINNSTNSDDYNNNNDNNNNNSDDVDNYDWTSWQNTQQDHNDQHFNQSQVQSHQTTSNQNQLQLIEYDFLTA